MVKRRIVKRRYKKKLPKRTYLGCPLTKNRSPWCFRMCAPDRLGKGKCGRPAPHALKSRIQIGIDDFKKRGGSGKL